MYLRIPDTDLGRCPNFYVDAQGVTQRCLRRLDNHAKKQCVMDSSRPVQHEEAYSIGGAYTVKPKPWVEPERIRDV